MEHPRIRGVLPHRGEGRINHQVVALTIKVQRHKIPRACVIQRAHPAELDLDAVTREACLLDDGQQAAKLVTRPLWMRCRKDAKGAGDRVSLKGSIVRYYLRILRYLRIVLPSPSRTVQRRLYAKANAFIVPGAQRPPGPPPPVGCTSTRTVPLLTVL